MTTYPTRWLTLCGAVFFGYLAVCGLIFNEPVVNLLDIWIPIGTWLYPMAGFLLCIALFVLSQTARTKTPEGKDSRSWRIWKARDGIAALLLLRVIVGAALIRAGYLFLSSDDFCRIEISINWSEKHWFATWDHVWLAGQFYVLGGLINLLKDPLMCARISSLAFSVFYMWIFYKTVEKSIGKTTAGFSTLLLAFMPYPAWLSVSAHSDPFFVAFALLGIFFLLRSEGKWGQLFFAASAFCFATMFRYEGLVLGVVYGVWTIVLIAANRSRWTAKAITAHAILCAIPFIYIALWSFDCYMVPEFDDAFHFLRGAPDRMPLWLAEKSPAAKLAWYPEVIYRLSPTVLCLSLLGMVLSLWINAGPRKPILRYLGVTVLNFVLLAFSTASGGGNVMAGRVMILTQILLLPFAVYAFSMPFDVVRARTERKKGIETGLPDWWTHEVPKSKKIKIPKFGIPLRVLLLVLFLSVVVLEAKKTISFPGKYTGRIDEDFWDRILFSKSVRGVPVDALRIVERFRLSQLSPDDEDKKPNCILVDGSAGLEVYWMFAAMAGNPHKTFLLSDERFSDIYNTIWEGGSHYYVGRGDPTSFPYEAETVDREGSYFLSRFTEGDPKRFMERMRPRFLTVEDLEKLRP